MAAGVAVDVGRWADDTVTLAVGVPEGIVGAVAVVVGAGTVAGGVTGAGVTVGQLHAETTNASKHR